MWDGHERVFAGRKLFYVVAVTFPNIPRIEEKEGRFQIYKFPAGASPNPLLQERTTTKSNEKPCLKMPSLPSTPSSGGTRETCSLFEICELVADLYRRACICEPNETKVLHRLEQQIMDYFDFNQRRAARLIELSMEISHLKMNGDYSTSELEVGRLICEVTNGWVEPGAN